MFERIVIRRHDAGSDPIDVGRFAETLLFYDDVHLLIDGSGLTSLLQKIGADALLELIKQKRITVTFVIDFLGTHNQPMIGGQTLHNFIAGRLAAHKDGRPVKRKHLIEETFDRVLGPSKLTRIKSDQFLRHVKFQEYIPADPAKKLEPDVTSQAYADLDDPQYTRAVVQKNIASKLPGFILPNNWYLRTEKTQRGFVIRTNLDVNTLKDEYRRRTGGEGDFSEAALIGPVLDVRGDLHFAAHYMAEMAIDPLRAELIQMRFGDFLKRRFASEAELASFQDIHLQSAVAIREAINSGSHSFKEFMSLLSRADKFRSWLKDLNPDSKLLDEYFQASTKDTWAEKLPAKSTRFAVLTGLGLGLDLALPTSGLGTALGVGAGAIDTFWLDQLIKGWRPNQFVSGPLKRFVDS